MRNTQAEIKLKEILYNLKDEAIPFSTVSQARISTDLPIYDLPTLALYIGATPEELKALTYFPSNVLYNTFYINKDTNKICPYDSSLRLREINAPTKRLKGWQERLIGFLKLFDIHECNYAFLEGKSIRNAAEAVKEGETLVHIDLKDFFSSHTANFVRNRLSKLFREHGILMQAADEIATYITHVCVCGTKLPQGSPCSPILTCILNKEMDCKISAVAAKYNVSYMRYADDLCFSGNLTNTEAKLLIEELADAVQPFNINWKKVNIMRDTAAPIFKGIIVRYNKGHYIPTSQSSKIVKMVTDSLPDTDNKVTVMKGKIIITVKSMEDLPLDDLNVLLEKLNTLITEKYPSLEARVRPLFYYIKSNKKVLGLNVNNNTVTYPRKKYLELRKQAQLIGIQRALWRTKHFAEGIGGYNNGDGFYLMSVVNLLARHIKYKGTGFRNLLEKPFNKRVFNGQVAFLSMVDKEKGDKLAAIQDKAFYKIMTKINEKVTSDSTRKDVLSFSGANKFRSYIARSVAQYEQ